MTGIRELKQNASAVVARAASGESITITDRGRPVARLTPLEQSTLDRLVASGAARAPRHSLVDYLDTALSIELDADARVSAALRDLREGERF